MSRPWDRLPGEPSKWHERFTRYRLAGHTRTLEAIWRLEPSKSKRPPKEWYRAAEKWNWKTRCFAFDEAVAAEREAEWRERKQALEEATWDLSAKMRERALTMLSWPLERRTVSRDGDTIIIEPADWRVSDIAKMAAVADQLARTACGEPIARLNVGGKLHYEITTDEAGEILAVLASEGLLAFAGSADAPDEGDDSEA